MKRKFSLGVTAASRYLSILDQNASTWQRVFPKTTKSNLDFYSNHKVDTKALDYCLNIVWDMLLRKGKKIRPVLMLLLGDIYSINQSVSLPLGFFVETVHNGTLIIDDIEDNSHSRRGEPCSHLKFGLDNSINAGVLSFFLPARNLSRILEAEGVDKSTRDAIIQIYIEEMTNLHLGLAWDVYWHSHSYSNNELPSESNFLKMVESKTSVLLRIGFRLLAEVAMIDNDEKQRVSYLANLIGQSFQIQDDIINLRSQDYSKGRGTGVGEDITEGKITLMVIEHMKKTKDSWLLDVLSKKTTDQDLINEAIQRMESSGAIDYADKFQRNLMKQATEEIDKLKGNSHHKNEFKQILLELLDRKI